MAEKLVRDHIIDFSLEKKDGRIFRVAKTEELPSFLSAKLREECDELGVELLKEPFSKFGEDRQRLIEEMVDVADVLQEVLNVQGISYEELSAAAEAKNKKKGGFSKHILMEI